MLRIGNKVRIARSCDSECNQDWIGTTGYVKNIIEHNDVGATPESPFIEVVNLAGAKEHFWPEELEEINA